MNAYDATHDPGSTFPADVFVTKLSAAGNTLIYSTYLGGSDTDTPAAIAVDATFNAYVMGTTESNNYPTQTPYQTYQPGGLSHENVFVTELSSAGSGLVYSTYLGGTDDDEGYGIALHGAGCAYIVGYTFSTNFPTQNPYQTFPGSTNGFLSKLCFQGLDADGDGIEDALDNCPLVANPLQEDNDHNGIGNACCCLGLRGNVNMLSIVDVSDLSLLVAYLTSSPAPTLPCPEAGNVNGISIVDVSDLSLLVAYLTSSPPPGLPGCP